MITTTASPTSLAHSLKSGGVIATAIQSEKKPTRRKQMKRLYQYEGRLTTRRPNDDENDVSLPYNGSSGWSGTDTSRERATTADSNGDTKKRQATVLKILRNLEERGATWKEMAIYTDWHHGTVSGALSVLHKDKRIARLTEQRSGCRVYVLPEYVYGRETDEQGRKHTCPECGHRF